MNGCYGVGRRAMTRRRCHACGDGVPECSVETEGAEMASKEQRTKDTKKKPKSKKEIKDKKKKKSKA
jgi:hypothetical protein